MKKTAKLRNQKINQKAIQENGRKNRHHTRHHFYLGRVTGPKKTGLVRPQRDGVYVKVEEEKAPSENRGRATNLTGGLSK